MQLPCWLCGVLEGASGPMRYQAACILQLLLVLLLLQLPWQGWPVLSTRWGVLDMVLWTCSKQCQLSKLPEAICSITPRCILAPCWHGAAEGSLAHSSHPSPEGLVALDLLTAVAIVVNATGV
jgi:hypothetical protein